MRIISFDNKTTANYILLSPWLQFKVAFSKVINLLINHIVVVVEVTNIVELLTGHSSSYQYYIGLFKLIT